MLTQCIGEDEENDSGDEEEEERIEKQSKSLALVTLPTKKANIVPKVKNIAKKKTPKPLSPPAP